MGPRSVPYPISILIGSGSASARNRIGGDGRGSVGARRGALEPGIAEDLSDGVLAGSPSHPEASISRRGYRFFLPSPRGVSSAGRPVPSPPHRRVRGGSSSSLLISSSIGSPPLRSSLSPRPFSPIPPPRLQPEDLRRVPPLPFPRAWPPGGIESSRRPSLLDRCSTRSTRLERVFEREEHERKAMATVTRMSVRQGTNRGTQAARLAKRWVPTSLSTTTHERRVDVDGKTHAKRMVDGYEANGG
eukprot:scaffold529_cov322-Pavlova_lutheri.AAC.2